jgi:protein tyrosine phosphatase (PTP) superfamily phosphohydrolase (DUF442 family)
VSSDPQDIRNWQRLSERITTSGRLEPHDPERLAAIGVRHVVNLALDEHPEALADEAALLARYGVRYTHIPVPFDAPEEAHYQAFAEALEAEGPVHVHCIMNWRVSAFFYRWHRDACGMAEPEARALMERQWSPEANDHPAAPAWAAFVAKRES